MTLQDTRVWAIEQLIKKENCLYPKMYECAQIYAEQNGTTQDIDLLYKAWEKYWIHKPTNKL